MKLIFDQGYVIAEGTGDIYVHYTIYLSQMFFSLRDQDGYIGNVNIGDGQPGDPSNADVLKMSFVLEMVPSNDLPEGQWDDFLGKMVPRDLPERPEDEEQVALQESSATLLEKVESISGSVVIRELHAGEQVQMNKLKQSPHAARRHVKVAYKNGETHIQSNANSTDSFYLYVDGDNNLSLMTNKKQAEISQLKGKSFVIEDSARSNCKSSRRSMGLDAHCSGTISVRPLYMTDL